MSDLIYITLANGRRVSTEWIYLVREVAPDKHNNGATAEIRAIGGAEGGFVKDRSVQDVAADLRKLGTKLLVLPSGTAAVREKWIHAAEPFEKPGTKPEQFGSLLQFVHPRTGAVARTAVPDNPLRIPGVNTAVQIGRPGGRSPKGGPGS
jgi:hypothetical protein